MSSTVLILSEEHETLLKQFKADLADILTPYHTDAILMKWLRARNYNLKKAESNFRTMDANRKMFAVNTILDTYVLDVVVEKCEATGFVGFAKDGTAIRYGSGRTDFYGFITSLSAYDLCLYFTHLMEYDLDKLRNENMRTGREVNEITYVLDMEGASIKQAAYKCVIEMGLDFSTVFQDFYPEIWRNVFIINAPAFFDKIFNIFKPMWRGPLLEKIHVVTKVSTAETLLKYIDEDVLPAFLGGKRVDSNGDPKCAEFIKFGCKVPVEYYSVNRFSLITASDPGVTVVDIAPRCSYNHSMVVKEAGSTLHMEFRTENGSIHGVMFLRKLGSNPDGVPDIPGKDEYLDESDEKCRVWQVTPPLRPQCHLSPINGNATAVWPGIYILRLTNVGSWFNSRRLYIRSTVTPPDSKEK